MILYFIIFISWLALLYLIGSLVSFLLLNTRFNPNPYELILRNTFLGYILIIVLQSVISTEFKTVNLILILLMVFSVIEIKKYKVKSIVKTNDLNFNNLLILIVISAALFIYSWFLIYNPDAFIKFQGTDDYILYGKISRFIALTGNENGFNVLNTMDKFYNGPEPYHYFDLWGAACVSNLFKINNFISLKLIIYPTFYFLYALGILALINRSSYKIVFLLFALLMIGGLSFDFQSNISFLDNLKNISFNLLNPGFSKLSYFYVFMISSYLLYKNNYFTLSFLCILSLPVANVITFPTVLPVLFVILAISYFTKSTDRKIIYQCLIYLAVFVIAFISFYVLLKRQSSGFAGTDISSPQKLLSENIRFINFNTQRNIFLASIVGIIILYLPFFLILVSERKKYFISKLKTNAPLLFVIFGILISILIWCVLYVELNSRQIHQNLSIPLLNIAFSIYIIEIINRNNLFKPFKFSILNLSLIFVMILIAQNFIKTIRIDKFKIYETHSAEYLSQIQNKIIPNSLIASLREAEPVETNSKYNSGYTLGDYLFLMKENVYPVNVGDLNILIDSTSTLNLYRSEKVISVGIFYSYSQFPENIKLSKDELIEKFLKKYNIQQMIVSENAEIPKTVLPYIVELFTDRISKERFVKLKL